MSTQFCCYSLEKSQNRSPVCWARTLWGSFCTSGYPLCKWTWRIRKDLAKHCINIGSQAFRFWNWSGSNIKHGKRAVLQQLDWTLGLHLSKRNFFHLFNITTKSWCSIIYFDVGMTIYLEPMDTWTEPLFSSQIVTDFFPEGTDTVEVQG